MVFLTIKITNVMGLLKGQDQTLVEGDYQNICNRMFYNIRSKYGFFDYCINNSLTVYYLIYELGLNIDEIVFLIENGYCTEQPIPVSMPNQFRGYKNTIHGISDINFCKGFINANGYYGRSCYNDDLYWSMLSCKVIMSENMINDYKEYVNQERERLNKLKELPIYFKHL